jgi:hypothetical protein
LPPQADDAAGNPAGAVGWNRDRGAECAPAGCACAVASSMPRTRRAGLVLTPGAHCPGPTLRWAAGRGRAARGVGAIAGRRRLGRYAVETLRMRRRSTREPKRSAPCAVDWSDTEGRTGQRSATLPMRGDPRLQRLLEEILDSNRTPEKVCQDYPELLIAVRERFSACARSKPSSTPRSGRQLPQTHLSDHSRRPIRARPIGWPARL